MQKAQTINTFNEGLVMDFNPLVTPNGTLTSCLNGTLITYNGNENVLQNDMGNGRVETAFLPEGYIPLGTTELGGIIYVVSYNPLTDKCLIGSFPSPERNISLTEKYENELNQVILQKSNFIDDNNNIIATTKKIEFDKLILHPGDKYKIYGENIDENIEFLSGVNSENYDINENPKLLKLRIASMDDSGKITYLDNIKWNEIKVNENDSYKYYIENGSIQTNSINDLDQVTTYREKLATQYNVFKNKSSGKLVIVANLEVIDQFEVAWDVNDKNMFVFYVNWTYENDNLNSKSEVNPLSIMIKSNILPKDDNDCYELNLSNIQRKNDGSDKPITIVSNFQVPIDQQENIIFDITPVMSFGNLKSLKKTIEINPNLLGTGAIELDRWKYYNDDQFCTLMYGFTINLKKNEKITDITFLYRELGSWVSNFYDNIDCDTPLEDSVEDSVEDWINLFINNNKQSYSGIFLKTILFNLLFLKDSCYVIKIQINKTNNQSLVFFRILYTNGVFNENYLDDSLLDFKKLNPNFKFNINVQKNIISLNVNLNLDSSDIPSKYKDSETNSEDKEYQFTAITELKPRFDIISKQGNKFTQNITKIKNREIVLRSNNASKRIIGSELSDVKNITITPSIDFTNNEKNSFTIENETIKVTDTITVPIKLNYITKEKLYPDRYLSPLVIGEPLYLFWLVHKEDGGCELELCEFADRSGKLSDSFDFGTGNKNNRITKTFNELSQFRQPLLEKFNSYDVIPLIIRIEKKSEHSSSDAYSCYWKSRQIYRIRDIPLNWVTFAYLIKGKNNYITLVAHYPATINTMGNPRSDGKNSGMVYYGANWKNNYVKQCTFPKLLEVFSKYYKLLDNSNLLVSLEKYIPTNITTYFDFNYTNDINYKLSLSSVQYNGYDYSMKTSDISDKIPTNLICEASTNVDIDFSYTNKIPVNDQIDKLENFKINTCVKTGSTISESELNLVNSEFLYHNTFDSGIYSQVLNMRIPLSDSLIYIDDSQIAEYNPDDYYSYCATKLVTPRVLNSQLIFLDIDANSLKEYLYIFYDDESLTLKAIGNVDT